jgi:hypothetical protein
MHPFVDKKFRLPRLWSNDELARFAPLFEGDVANVSGWKDEDKAGRHYRDYFSKARSYTITNYRSEARGFQGVEGEIFLDLTASLPEELKRRFDVVLNHTALEHIYEVRTAFANLCAMTRDIAIVVVPFLQPMHSDYGDYWRFSPQAIEKLWQENGLDPLYLSFNSHRKAAVYIFSIGSRNPEKWAGRIPRKTGFVDPRKPSDRFEPYCGCHSLPNTGYAIARRFRKWFGLR